MGHLHQCSPLRRTSGDKKSAERIARAPESTKNIGEITVGSGIAEKLIVEASRAAVEYCRQSAGQCFKVVAGVFGTRL